MLIWPGGTEMIRSFPGCWLADFLIIQHAEPPRSKAIMIMNARPSSLHLREEASSSRCIWPESFSFNHLISEDCLSQKSWQKRSLQRPGRADEDALGKP